MTYRGPELATRLPEAGHAPGPEQDHRARLAVVRCMSESGATIEEMADILDCLALLPGQEDQRGAAIALTTMTRDPSCTPTTSRDGYRPI